ncbi:MAG: hypothetical protein GY915_08585 [bacterium]|nr:hypothetical protein [bacterium]
MSYAQIKNITLDLTKVLLEETKYLRVFDTAMASKLLEKKEKLSYTYERLLEA